MPVTTRPPVIECRGLSKVFKDFWLRSRVQAVSALDLTVDEGEIFGLLGPNGSGKSTTIKILLGLLFPTAGEVRIFGGPATDVRVKSRIGYLPEDSHLYPFLNAEETLDYYGRLFHLDRATRRRRIEELLDMVGLQDARKRRVGEYSKGMQRRIGLAQALINDPDLLILDEPTSGLDPLGTRQVKDLVLELQRAGKTVLISSHLLADIEDVCTRLAILYGGRIRASGSVEELLTESDAMILRTDPIRKETVQKVAELIRAEEGKKLHGAEAARRRLEALFLDIVEAAESEGDATSGSVAGGVIASFLRGADRGEAKDA